MLIAQSAIDCQCPHCPYPSPPSLPPSLSYLLSLSLCHSQLIAEHFIWPPNLYLRSDHKYFPALISMRLHCCLSPPLEDFRTYFIVGVAEATSRCLLFGTGSSQCCSCWPCPCAGLCRLVHACACLCVHVYACTKVRINI